MIADRITAHLIFCAGVRDKQAASVPCRTCSVYVYIYRERERNKETDICAERFPTDSILTEMIAICCIMFTIIDGAE